MALSLALGCRSEVLLLDEPLANLDPLARREFLAVLSRSVRADGTTSLLASHVVSDIQQVCDHLVVLGIGSVLLDSGVDSALSSHCVVRGDATEDPGSVGLFSLSAGEGLTLLMHGAHAPKCRPASLEEVVLGYLSAGRRSNGADLDEAESHRV